MDKFDGVEEAHGVDLLWREGSLQFTVPASQGDDLFAKQPNLFTLGGGYLKMVMMHEGMNEKDVIFFNFSQFKDPKDQLFDDAPGDRIILQQLL